MLESAASPLLTCIQTWPRLLHLTTTNHQVISPSCHSVSGVDIPYLANYQSRTWTAILDPLFSSLHREVPDWTDKIEVTKGWLEGVETVRGFPGCRGMAGHTASAEQESTKPEGESHCPGAQLLHPVWPGGCPDRVHSEGGVVSCCCVSSCCSRDSQHCIVCPY